MYCVVCLKNRARDFFCPYCEDNIKVLFRRGQIEVAKEVLEDFKSLPINKQWEVIYLTNKRMGKMLKAGFQKELHLGFIINDYTQMILLRQNELDIPVQPNDDITFRRYHQYGSPRKGDEYVR